jgi:hypothetical protein
MFTIYIHILEVLASHLEGTFADNIHEMGSCFERKLIDKGLRELEKEGFVNFRKLGKTKIWSITEKAIEYCHIVVKKDYDANYAKEALAMHDKRKKEAQEGPQKPIAEVSEAIKDDNASDLLSSQSSDHFEHLKEHDQMPDTSDLRDDEYLVEVLDTDGRPYLSIRRDADENYEQVTHVTYESLPADDHECPNCNSTMSVQKSQDDPTKSLCLNCGLTFEPIFEPVYVNSPDALYGHCDLCNRPMSNLSEQEAGTCSGCQQDFPF